MWVRGAEGRVAFLLRLAGRSTGALFCLPLARLPLRGPLRTTDNEELDAQVVTVAWQHGLVLLQLPPAAAGNTVALPARAAATLTGQEPLEVRDPAGRSGQQATLVSPLGGALYLQLREHVPEGAALVLADHVVAYSTGGRGATPLDPLIPWLRRPQLAPAMTLGALQKKLRGRDPKLVLQDASALLAATPHTMQRVTDAISLLEQTRYLARDADTTKAYEELLRQAHHQQVLAQSKLDPVQALILARQSLLRFPDHAGLLTTAIALSLDQSNGKEAATIYRQLLGVSPEHARVVADDVASGLATMARGLRRGHRNQEALEVLARAVGLFPTRPDLRLAYAQTLLGARREQEALAQADEAARLDPAYRRHLKRYELTARSGGRHAVHVIPYDPKTRIIRAKATVQGHELRFLVDTGASLTTVPSALADKLGLRNKNNPRVKVTTASGEMEVEVVVLPSLKLGKIRLTRVKAAVLDLPGRELANTGLLGLNVLQRLNMEIDSENSQLILRRRRKRR